MFSATGAAEAACDRWRGQALDRAEVLVVDCQSTGANPRRGALLEIGWGVARAADEAVLRPPGAICRVLALPDGQSVPRRVAALTGLSAEDLAAGVAAEDVWAELSNVARGLASKRAAATALAVIHFARFEEPFLRRLHQGGPGQAPFPLAILCLHEVARRLLPELPRRGLRALAGYFGHAVPPPRRCSFHVDATAVLWRALVQRLEQQVGIVTVGQLRSWLAQPAPPSRGARGYPLPRERRLAVAARPGIYRFLRGEGGVLYVGKARSLRARVNSYFQNRTGHGERTLEMLTQARDIEIEECETALEAALLESDEIKRAAPPYNVALHPGQRRIWFADGGLTAFAASPSRDHRRGPLRDTEALSAVRALLDGLGEGGSAAGLQSAAAAVLQRSSARPLEPACWSAGFHAFRQRYVPFAEQPGGEENRWMALGAELWRSRQQALSSTSDAEPTSAPVEDPPEPSLGAAAPPDWTPERVARRLCDVVLHGALALRRASWLCRLSESVLTWRRPGAERWRQLVLSGGAIVDRRWTSAHDGGVEAPGAARSAHDRRGSFDLPSFDRLQVLSAELKRLGSEAAEVELRGGPRERLRSDGLRRALFWI